MKRENRIIADYTENQPGPLLIAFGGMHGNEPAGVKAIQTMQKMLEAEPEANPSFSFKGKFIGLIGNMEAYKNQKRYIKRDLNRTWTRENANRVKSMEIEDLTPEQKELKEVLAIVEKTIKEYKPEKIVVLDLHTTSSFGGIFSIATDDPESTQIAIELHAPVITGMLEGISGTTLHYFNEENLGVPTVAVTFESGQHDEALSVNRAIAAITNCMRTIGSVSAQHIENSHDSILIEYSKNLPKVSQLIHCHTITEDDNFRMNPGYSNFQKINKGEIIAKDRNGIIKAIDKGRILMPLYQKQGEDGFFLVQELLGY